MSKKPSIIVRDVGRKYSRAVTQGISESLAPLTKDIPDQIRTRTRLGGGVAHDGRDRLGGSRTKLDKLSNRYKEQRSAHKSRLDKNTTPARSNLTATGQLLKAIKAQVTGFNQITIDLEKRRNVDLRGNASKINNEQLLEYVELKRKFFGLTDAELNKFRRFVREKILSKLNKIK